MFSLRNMKRISLNYHWHPLSGEQVPTFFHVTSAGMIPPLRYPEKESVITLKILNVPLHICF